MFLNFHANGQYFAISKLKKRFSTVARKNVLTTTKTDLILDVCLLIQMCVLRRRSVSLLRGLFIVDTVAQAGEETQDMQNFR